MKHKMKNTACYITGAIFFIVVGVLGSILIQQSDQPENHTIPEINPEVSLDRAPTGMARLYGKISSVTPDTKKPILTLRLLEMVLGGDNQEQVAIEEGRCTLDLAETDNCVPSGLYIRSTSKDLVLPIADDVNIKVIARSAEGQFLSDEDGNLYQKNISIKELGQHMKDWNLGEVPFNVTTQKGEVVGLIEQYLP